MSTSSRRGNERGECLSSPLEVALVATLCTLGSHPTRCTHRQGKVSHNLFQAPTREIKMKLLAVFAAILLVASVNSSPTGSECEVCRVVSDAVERVLVLNSTTTQSYQHVASKLCLFLPTELKHSCQDSIRQLPVGLYRCMVQAIGMNSICSDPSVGLCKVPVHPLTRVKCTGMPAYQHTCAACKFVVGGLEHYMAHAIPESLKAAHGICIVRFQDPLEQKKCHSLLDTQGELLIRTMVSRVDAEDFCCGTGICERTPLFVKKIAPLSPEEAEMNKQTDAVPGPVTAMMEADKIAEANRTKATQAAKAVLDAEVLKQAKANTDKNEKIKETEKEINKLEKSAESKKAD